jgi:hypothetical protein
LTLRPNRWSVGSMASVTRARWSQASTRGQMKPRIG